MCHEAGWELPCSIQSASAARRNLAHQLDHWGVTSTDVAYPVAQGAILVLSELVGNAVRFCSAAVMVKVVAHHDRIEVAVTDDSAEPVLMKYPDPMSTGGRGMQMVEALSEEWGQAYGEGQKTVWARLAIPPGSNLQHHCKLLPD